MFLVFGPKTVHFGFFRFHELAFDARLVVQGGEWRLVNWLVSRLLMPVFFSQKYAFPKSRGFWLVDKVIHEDDKLSILSNM